METGASYTKLDPDTDERFISLRRALGVRTFGIKHILLQARQGDRIHRHQQPEEVFIVLPGTPPRMDEGEPRALGQGELARVAPNVKRQLVNRDPGENC